MKIETIAIHSGNKINSDSKAVVQPITLSTTFQRGEDGSYPGGHTYTRASNPNRLSLENLLAELEGGQEACAFSSGNAAGSAVFQALEPGSHVIAPEDMYHGLKALMNEVFGGRILDISFIDMSNIDLLKKTIKPHTTKLIWIETPSNPLLKITDIRQVCELAELYGITVCCDNTFSTPVFQNPLQLGAHLVMHSNTKYLGGHSDVLGGALITKNNTELWERIKAIQVMAGGVPSPFDCYMAVRGIKTLPYRMRGHADNAEKIAVFLAQHPAVEKVYYPGLEDHPQHHVAKKQMNRFGGMLSFTLKGGETAARKVAAKVQIITQATSLGGVESLIEHRFSVEGPQTKTPPSLLRLSVGLENIEDLIDDLSRALS